MEYVRVMVLIIQRILKPQKRNFLYAALNSVSKRLIKSTTLIKSFRKKLDNSDLWSTYRNKKPLLAKTFKGFLFLQKTNWETCRKNHTSNYKISIYLRLKNLHFERSEKSTLQKVYNIYFKRFLGRNDLEMTERSADLETTISSFRTK